MIANVEIAERLALAALLGSLVGFERERLLWAAGVRTHMLVSVGACLLMITSAYGFQDAIAQSHVVLDPSRIAAQVVSGVGFLGAGSILMRDNVVRGLTTAASVWSVAAIGLATGGGLWFAAILTTALILVILAGLKPLEEAYRARIQSVILTIGADRGAIQLDTLAKQLSIASSQIKRFTALPGDEDLDSITLHLAKVSERDIRATIAKLKALPGVHKVEADRKKLQLDRG